MKTLHGFMITASVCLLLGGGEYQAGADGAKPETGEKMSVEKLGPNWVKVRDHAEWQDRDSAGELVYKDRLWILGGWFDSYKPTPRDVWNSADGKTWDLVTPMAPWKHGDLAMTLVFKDRMWTMGGAHDGRLPGSSLGNAVWSSTDGANWEQATAKAGWSPRSAAGLAAFKGRMWILGGGTSVEADSKNVRNDIWSSADGKDWKLEMEHAPWSPRSFLGTVVHDDKLWVLGGGNYHPYSGLNDVWCSSDGVNWEQVVEHAPWNPRIWFSAITYRDRIWILGGWIPPYVNRNDIWYSRDGKQWTEYRSELPLEERHEHHAYVFQDKIWVAGGMVGLKTWRVENDVWSLDIPKDWFER